MPAVSHRPGDRPKLYFLQQALPRRFFQQADQRLDFRPEPHHARVHPRLRCGDPRQPVEDSQATSTDSGRVPWNVAPRPSGLHPVNFEQLRDRRKPSRPEVACLDLRVRLEPGGWAFEEDFPGFEDVGVAGNIEREVGVLFD